MQGVPQRGASGRAGRALPSLRCLSLSPQGVIDYIFYSNTHMNVLGVLGPLDPQWLVDNNITGCPHPHIPSDHFSLLTQLELHPPLLPLVNGVHLPSRR